MATGRPLLDLDEGELVEMLTPIKRNSLEMLAAVAAGERRATHGEAGSNLETQAIPRGQGSSTRAVVGLLEAGRKPGVDQPDEKQNAVEESEKEWSPLNRNDNGRRSGDSYTRRRSRKGRETHPKSSRRRRSTSSSASSASSDQSENGRSKRALKERHRTMDVGDRVVKDELINHKSPSRGKKEKHRSYAMSNKLGSYDGQRSLETFLAKFENCSDYFEWSEADRLFHLRASLDGAAGQLLWAMPKDTTVEKVTQLLRNRFGNINQSERFRAEIKMRKRRSSETLQALYIDITRLISLAYPGPSSSLLDIVARDAFLDALDDDKFRVRVLEREPKSIDDALSIACRLEAYDKGAACSYSSNKSEADFGVMKPKYVKTAGSGVAAAAAQQLSSNTRPVNDMAKQLELIQLAVSRCQEESKSQRDEMRAQCSELRSLLSQSSANSSVDPVYSDISGNDRSAGWVGNGGAGVAVPGGAPLIAGANPAYTTPPTNSLQYGPQRTKGRNLGGCYTCGATGHYARDHRNGKLVSNETIPKQARGVISGEFGGDVYLRAKLYGQSTLILLDTGCEQNICGRRLIPEVLLQPTSQKLLAANSTPIELLGCATIVITVCGVAIPIDVVVSSEIDELICGVPFLQQHNCKWDFSRSLLELNGCVAKLVRRPIKSVVRRIYVNNDVKVPVNHMADVSVHIARPNLRQAADHWAVELGKLPASIIAARTLVNDDAGQAVVRVINLSNEPITLRSGRLVGEAEPVHVYDTGKTGPDQQLGRESNHEDLNSNTGLYRETMIDEPPALSGLLVDLPEQVELLYSDASVTYGHLQPIIDSLPRDLTDKQRQKAIRLIQVNHDVFSVNDEDLGLTTVLSHEINTGDNRPVKESLRRHPQAYLSHIDKFVEDLLRRDLIEPSHSAWSSNVVIVRKANNSLRFCCDNRRINNLTIKDAYPLPRIDTCLESMGGAKWFSILDANSAYWQVPLKDEASKDRTSFVTHKGLFRFKVMNFGNCNAPATYQRLMDLVLAGLCFESCLVFLDDVICFATTFDSACDRLQAVLNRMREANLKLKPTKCKLFQSSVRFLGSIVGRDGISADPEKIELVLKWPRPRNLTEVRGFCALTSYYRRHILNYAAIARPLYDLTRKGKAFDWGEDQEKAFVELKQCLTSAPLLAAPIDGGKYILDTDASAHAVSAILQQEQDGVLKVICYASRVLQPSETSYCSTKLELLAVIFGLKQYRHFLLCRNFIIRTDNAALTYLLRTPEPLAQQSRWLNLISEYLFTIVHRAGISNGACDSLSRKPCERDNPDQMCLQCRPRSAHQTIMTDPCRMLQAIVGECSETGGDHGSTVTQGEAAPVSPPVTECEVLAAGRDTPLFDSAGVLSVQLLQAEQQRNVAIKRIMELLTGETVESNWEELAEADVETNTYFAQRQTLEVRNGVLYRQFQNSDGSIRNFQAVIPPALRTSILTQIHGGRLSGHFGYEKCRQRLVQYAYWPGWQTDMKLYISCCNKCNRYRKNNHTRQAYMKHASVNAPWQKVHIDLMGPYVRSHDGFVYILTVSCSFTKYLITVPLRNKEAFTVARELVRRVYLQYGPVEILIHDNGSEFCNSLLLAINQLMDVQVCRVTAYRPVGNSICERIHATLHKLLATSIDANQKNWTDWLPYVTYAYNTSHHSSTTFTPFYLMFMRDPLISLDFLGDVDVTLGRDHTPDEYVLLVRQRLRTAYELVHVNLQRSFERSKRRFDIRVRACRFKVGEQVWFYSPRKFRHLSPKWTLQTTGPYDIIRKLNDVNYVIRQPGKRRSFTVHVDRLRLYKPPLNEVTGGLTNPASPRRSLARAESTITTPNTRPNRNRRIPRRFDS